MTRRVVLWGSGAILAFVVFLAGSALVLGNDTKHMQICDRSTYDVQASLVSTGGSLWPPGHRCQYRLDDGRRIKMLIPAPWTQVAAVALSMVAAIALPHVLNAAPKLILALVFRRP